MAIRLRVRLLAVEQGIKDPAQLSRKADISYATAHRMWNDNYDEQDRGVGHMTLKKVASVLGVKVQDLIDEDRQAVTLTGE